MRCLTIGVRTVHMRRRNLNLPKLGGHPRSHERAVEAAACECYRIVKSEFDRLLRA
jgi:hypothetical protein